MKAGFLLTILFIFFTFALFSGALYYYTQSLQTVNENTKYAVTTIIKYPTATNWQIKYNHNSCLLTRDQCTQPAYAKFESQDNWSSIYTFYRHNMLSRGWSTTSQIFTSIPTSITFYSNTGCAAELAQSKSVSLFEFFKSKSSNYSFKVACLENLES